MTRKINNNNNNNNNNNTRKTNTSLKENDSMSKNNEITIVLSDETIAAIAAQVAEVLGEAVVEAKPAAKGKSTKAAPAKKGKAKAEPEPEEDEDESEEEDEEEFDQEARQAELAKMRITALRKMAIELGFPEDEVADADKDTLAESIAEAEAEDAGVEPGDDEDAEDEEDDEAEEDEEEDDEDGEDYESMTIAELRKAAKEAGYKAADIKGLKKDEIIDLLNDEDEGEEEDEDADEDEDGEDEEWYTEEDLEEMSLAELKAICKDYSIKVPRGAKQADLIDVIVNYDGE